MTGYTFDFDAYPKLKEEHIKALDALQKVCRRYCDWSHGYYNSKGSRVLYDAIAALVRAGRLEYIHDDIINPVCMAKDVTEEKKEIKHGFKQ